MKKYILIIAIGIVLFLSACGSKKEATTNGTNDSTQVNDTVLIDTTAVN
jgi:protein involved in sex pheromone biosynthesis